jgi:ribosome assembly protein YihI (activator of Der GTPase)
MTDKRGRLSIRLNPEVASQYRERKPDSLSHQAFVSDLLNRASITVEKVGLSDDDRRLFEAIHEDVEKNPGRTAEAVKELLDERNH